MVYVWRSEANLWELVLSLYHTDPRNLTRAIRPGGKLLFTRRHPASPPLPLLSADLDTSVIASVVLQR